MLRRLGDVVEVSTKVDPWAVLDHSIAPLRALFPTCLTTIYISNFNSNPIHR